jgi:hypothetical protein
MELQIEIEREPSKALYQLSDGEIVGAFRNAEALLASHDINREATAAALGLSPITLKAYSRGASTVAHRRIPAVTLDRIRDVAVDAYWRAAAHPYRVEKAGSVERSYVVPTWHAHDNVGLVRDRHPHPLRIREVADKLGGHVTVAWSVDMPKPRPASLDPEASLRSRWRVGAWQIYGAFQDPEDAAELLCEIADCCRYSVWTLSTEYRPWMTQVTTSQVERLEAAIADKERGDDIQPWESAVAKAMADLEDF